MPAGKSPDRTEPFGGRDTAAAELIGTLILVAIFVSVVAVLMLFIFSSSPSRDIPAANFGFASDGSHITIRHNGGDPLPEGSYRIRLNGETLSSSSVAKSPLPSGSWQIGEILTLAPAGVSPSAYVEIVYSKGGSDFWLLASNGTPVNSPTPVPTPVPGSKVITLNAAKAAYVESGGAIRFRVTGSYSTISVNGVTYPLNAGDAVQLVAGSNQYGTIYSTASTITTFSFSDVSFYQNGVFMNRGAVGTIWVSGYDQFQSSLNLYMPPVSAWTSFVVDGTSLINGQDSTAIRITGLGRGMNLAATSGNVYYTGSASGYEYVSAPAPQVTGITPATGMAGSTVTITDLSGKNFDTAGIPVVKLQKGTGAITATSVTVVSSTRIQCTFSLAGASTGSWDVVVTNPDGQSATGSGLFTVTPGLLAAGFTYTLPSSNVIRVTDATTGGPPVSWDWDFGDGTTHATVQAPADHAYSTGGLYTVNLTVTNGTAGSSARQDVLATLPASHTLSLNAAKSAYVESGSVVQFRVTGSYSTITVNGTTYSLAPGDTVRLVFYGNEHGTLYSTASAISTFSFGNVSFSENGVYRDRGTVGTIWVSGYDQYQSALNLYVPASSAWTSLSADGTTLISGTSSSSIRLTGLSGAMTLTAATGTVYYTGGAAGYQLG